MIWCISYVIDTHRLWEAIGLGSMAVIERGVGLDRTVYKLPVLLLDDFAEISPFIVRQAYVEALYRADDWEYERITQRFEVNLFSYFL